MITILRDSLISILLVLQLFAPLIHAHTHDSVFITTGLHLPNLEIYSLNNDTKQHISTANFIHAELNDIIISIDTGTQHKKQKSGNIQYDVLITQAFCFHTFYKNTVLFPITIALINTELIKAYTIRAPPVID
jgi:hypothetical protein